MMVDELGPQVPTIPVQDDPEPTPAPVEQIGVHQVALEVLAGRWGRGNVRRDRLAKAGHDVDAVIDEVNKILY